MDNQAGQGAALLRDLSDAQFLASYQTDRFTASVLANRMRYIVKHMCTGLLNNAFSQILRDWYDFAATISGPPELNYPMSAVSDSLMLFTGTMGEAIRNMIEEYGPENLRPGDVVIANDPYRVGNHVNDVCFVRPVFHEGRIIAFVNIRAHQLDMGGIVPAGFSGSKRNVYETGLVLSPILLYAEDKPVRSTFNLIFDNARFCSLLLPDIKSLYQNLLLGERLILESVKRYGPQAFLGALRYCCDISADSMLQAIRAKIPDGTYTAEEGIDADGIDSTIGYKIKLKVVKKGDNIEVDLSGTSKEARSSINCTALDVKTSVGVALKMLIEQGTPFTSGSFRNIDIIIPAGTFVSATPPDGPVFIYFESSSPVIMAVYRALANALGPDAIGGDSGSMMLHSGVGTRPDGSLWVTAAQVGGEHGPWSGTKAGDGDSYNSIHCTNGLDPATEAIESEVPVVLLRKEYVTDTPGAGRHRGGAAVVKDSLWLEKAEHWSVPLHTKFTSGFGVYGGKSGTMAAVWMFPPDVFDVREKKTILPLDEKIYASSTPVAGLLDPKTKVQSSDGEFFYFASRPSWSTDRFAIFRYQTSSGGGWGRPVDRDPERVLRDVRDEYISAAAARRDYGVVVLGDPVRDPEGLKIDWEATNALRSQMS